MRISNALRALLLGPLAGIVLANVACNAILGNPDPTGDAPGPRSDAGAQGSDRDGGAPDAPTASPEAGADAPDTSSSAPTAHAPLKSFAIAPLYYGAWAQAQIEAQQAYLTGVAQYISGANTKAHMQTVLVQYGVTSAMALPAATQAASGGAPLDESAALDVIHAAQKAGTLPDYAEKRLVLLLVADHTMLAGDRCAYHGAEGPDRNYAVVSLDCEPALRASARMIFESAIDPAGVFKPGAGASCDGVMPAWFGNGGLPSVFDTLTQTCSTTGYDPANDASAPGLFYAVWRDGAELHIQMNGVTQAQFDAREDELSDMGWRLKVLEPYVAGDQILYNASWRPGTDPEQHDDGLTPTELQTKLDTLSPQGWRLKLFSPYVSNDQVRYSAVWEKGTEPESLILGMAADAFKTMYDALYQQGNRLKLVRGYAVADQAYFTAVYHASTEEEKTLFGVPYSEFSDFYSPAYPQFWRLKVFQQFELHGAPAYTCVFEHLSTWIPEWQIWDHSFDGYRSDDDLHSGEQMHLVDMTAIVY